jgi:Rps23 Pro-64 3,4-dihydroxylase Tpa1-like proline 4-hydroxylase
MNSTLKFQLDLEYLNQLALKYRSGYNQAAPFPHIVIDDFLPPALLESVLHEFPQVHSVQWKTFDNAAEKKLASTHELQMGELTRFLLYQLNSSTFLTFLEQLTGIDGLIPDPHFVGGGLHQIERGGYLKMHVDFNRYERLKLDRRLNLLIYLNQNWSEEYGGHLELWDQDMTRCEKKILPIFNRCVIFSTTDFSYHGHPEPLTCPEDMTRKSLALYYYSNGRPAIEAGDAHSTIFRERPGLESLPLLEAKCSKKEHIKRFIPPILIKQWDRFKNYRR